MLEAAAAIGYHGARSLTTTPEAALKTKSHVALLTLLLSAGLVGADVVDNLDPLEVLIGGSGVDQAAAGAHLVLDGLPDDPAALETLVWTELLRGRDRAALDRVLALLAADASGMRGEAFIRDLLRYSDYSDAFSTVEALLDKLADGDGLTPGARRALERWRLFFARRRGDGDEIDRAEARCGLLTDWQVVGPFVRSGPLDLDHEFAPERRPRESYELPGLDEAAWMSPPRGLSRGFLPIEEVTSIPRGCAYAVCYLYLPATGEYNLNLVSDDALKVWLDGELIGLRDDVRGNPAVELDFPFRADAGWHRLLIKCNRNNYVTSSQVEVTWGFKAELTDSAGFAVDGLRCVGDWDLDERTAGGVKALDTGAVVDDDGLTDRLHRAIVEAHREDYDTAVRRLSGLVEERPGSLPARLLLARVLESDGSEERLGRARTHYQRLVAADPLIVHAQLSLAEIESAEGKFWSALKRLQSLQAAVEPNPDIELALAYRYNEKSLTPREGAAFARAVELAPDYLEALLQSARFQNRADDHPAAIETLERLLSAAPDHRTARADLADLLQQGGYYREAAEHYRRLIELDPYDTEAMLELARCYYKGGFGDRDEVYREMIAASPYDYRGYVNLALALEEEDGEPREDLLAAALEHYPAKDWLRRYLAWRSDALSDEFMPDVEELLAREVLPEDHPKCDAAMLLDYLRLDINADYTYSTAVRQVVKILAPSGVERWGEIVIPDSDNLELIHARTYTPDGQVLEATSLNSTGDGTAISMEGARPGAIIDVYYRQHSEYRVITEIFENWSSRFYFREYGDPMLVSRFVVTAPEEMELDYDRLHYRGDFHREELPDGLTTEGETDYHLEPRDVFIHEVQNARPIQPEGLMPEKGSFAPFVVFSTIDEHEVYFDWYYGRALNALQPDEPLRRLAERLTENIDDPLDRARAIYSYIVREIKSYGAGAFYPSSARATYYQRAGRSIDKLVLFIALCREADLEVELCLTRSRWDGPRMPDAFTPAEFTDPIGRLDIGGEVYWVDFQPGWAPLGSYSVQYEGQPVWRCAARRFDELPRRPLNEHGNEITVELLLQPGLPTRGFMEQAARGLTSAMRVNYADNRDARDMIDYELNNMFPGAELIEYGVEATDDVNAPFVYRAVFDAPGQATAAAGVLKLPVVLYPYNFSKTFITRTERDYDLAYSDFLHQDETLIYRLQPGWNVAPSSLFREEIEGIEASYELSAELSADDEGPLLIVHRRLDLPPQQVDTDDYDEFREFCRRLDELERLQLTVELD